MPGHKFDPELLPELTDFFGAGVFTGDLNEAVPTIDYLHAATGALVEAQQLAAAAVGADHTFFLINGSTVGNQAMFMRRRARRAESASCTRAAHRSVYAGLILSGATPVYIAPRVHPLVHFPLAVEVGAVQRAAGRTSRRGRHSRHQPQLLRLSLGCGGLVKLAHAHDIPLLVDEAHGAHLRFHPDLPARP